MRLLGRGCGDLAVCQPVTVCVRACVNVCASVCVATQRRKRADGLWCVD